VQADATQAAADLSSTANALQKGAEAKKIADKATAQKKLKDQALDVAQASAKVLKNATAAQVTVQKAIQRMLSTQNAKDLLAAKNNLAVVTKKVNVAVESLKDSLSDIDASLIAAKNQTSVSQELTTLLQDQKTKLMDMLDDIKDSIQLATNLVDDIKIVSIKNGTDVDRRYDIKISFTECLADGSKKTSQRVIEDRTSQNFLICGNSVTLSDIKKPGEQSFESKEGHFKPITTVVDKSGGEYTYTEAVKKVSGKNIMTYSLKKTK